MNDIQKSITQIIASLIASAKGPTGNIFNIYLTEEQAEYFISRSIDKYKQCFALPDGNHYIVNIIK